MHCLRRKCVSNEALFIGGVVCIHLLWASCTHLCCADVGSTFHLLVTKGYSSVASIVLCFLVLQPDLDSCYHICGFV